MFLWRASHQSVLVIAALLAACAAPSLPTPRPQPPPASATAPPSATVPDATDTEAPTAPAACLLLEQPAVILSGNLYQVRDTETLSHLGFQPEALEPCPAHMPLIAGAVLGRLLKGSTDPVYWMEDGQRRWIPDMQTFLALGHQPDEIATVPDDALDRWPLGDPLPAQTPIAAATPSARPSETTPPRSPVAPTPITADTVLRTISIGAYTLQLWQPGPGRGLAGYATLTGADGAVTRVEAATDVLATPAADLTGDGEPDVVLALDTAIGSHCCTGFAVYNLGATPVRVLENLGDAYDYSGRGSFVELDGDGRYEVITYQRLDGIACSNPEVKVVLTYDPVVGQYRHASPRYPAAFADDLARLTAQAEATMEATRRGDGCALYPLIATYLVLDQSEKADSEIRRLYLGEDREAFWEALQTGVRTGRFSATP